MVAARSPPRSCVYAVIAAVGALGVAGAPARRARRRAHASDISTALGQRAARGRRRRRSATRSAPGFGSILRALVGLSARADPAAQRRPARSPGATRLIRSLGDAGALPAGVRAHQPALALLACGQRPDGRRRRPDLPGRRAVRPGGDGPRLDLLVRHPAGVHGGLPVDRLPAGHRACPRAPVPDARPTCTSGAPQIPFFALVGFALSWLVWLLVAGHPPRGPDRAAAVAPGRARGVRGDAAEPRPARSCRALPHADRAAARDHRGAVRRRSWCR